MSLPPTTTPPTPHANHAHIPGRNPPPKRTEIRPDAFPSFSHPVTASLPSFLPLSTPLAAPLTQSLATPKPAAPTPTILTASSAQNSAFPGQIFPTASTSTPPSSTPVSAEEARLVRQDGVRKRRWAAMGFKPDEQEFIARRGDEIHLALALDQEATLYPENVGQGEQGEQSGPKRFRSFEDVVDRLLPWHVWQIHDEELEGVSKGPIKDKIREQRELAEVTSLAKRISVIHDRFAIARWRAGTHESDLPSLINMINASTSDIRNAKNVVDEQKRDASARWAAMESERLRKEMARAEKERILVAAANAAAAPAKSATSARTPASTPIKATSLVKPLTPVKSSTTAKPPIPVKASRQDSSALPGGPPSDRNESDISKPRGRPKSKGQAGLRESVSTQTTAATTLKTLPRSSTSVTPVKSSPVSAASTRAPHAKPATTLSGTAKNIPASPASLSKLATTNGGPSGSTRSSAVIAGTPPLGPVSITVSVALVSGFMKLGVLATANKTAPGKVVRTSDDKTSLVLSIDLAACTQSQLQGLAKLLNVAAKPAGADAGGAVGQIADAAENARTQAS